ncbi:MAG: hypothetical protein QW833_02715 [Candidatus Anstonellaceae archaeon]
MQKVGVIFLLFFIYFSFSQVCQPPLDSSFIRSYYELDGDKVKVYLNLFAENKGDSLVGPTIPIKYGFILLNLKSESDDSRFSCYVVTNEEGKAAVELDVSAQTCYVLSAEFVPLASSPSLQKNYCRSSLPSNLTQDYSQNYTKSFTQLKFCTPRKQNATFNLCWFSTIIAGIIFLANFIMGRNPLMFFDFGVARNLPSRHFSSTLYYSPMSKQKDNESKINNVLKTATAILDSADKATDDIEKSKDIMRGKKNDSKEAATQSNQQTTSDSNTSNSNPLEDNKKSTANSLLPPTVNKYIGLAKGLLKDPISSGFKLLKSDGEEENSITHKAKDIGTIAGIKGLVNMVAFVVTPRKSKFTPRAPFTKGPFFKNLFTKEFVKDLKNTAAVGGGAILNSVVDQSVREMGALVNKQLENLNQNNKGAEWKKELGIWALNTIVKLGKGLTQDLLTIITKRETALKTGNRGVDDFINHLVNQSSGAVEDPLFNYSLYKATLDALNKYKTF